MTTWFQGEGEAQVGTPIARVYESVLYREDMQEVLPPGMSADDSVAFVQNYINVWAKNQLMVYKAQYNLTDQQKRFEKQIEAYRNDLLKHSYLQKYIAERLDTNVSEEEVRAYYQENPEQFQLKENILRVRYLVVPQEAPQFEELQKNFKKLDDPATHAEVLDYALRYARFFALEDTNWMSFSRFSQLVPVQTYNQQEFLNNHRYVELKRNGYFFLAEIIEYKIKDSPSPLVYVYDMVESTLRNKRRMALIQDLEQNLLVDAQKKNEFEVY